MPRNCPSCVLREKYHGMDGGGGDFWRCTATPLLPAFDGCFIPQRSNPPLVNLRSFEPDHPCHDHQTAKSCPLWRGEQDPA